jgi:hypothetical protein
MRHLIPLNDHESRPDQEDSIDNHEEEESQPPSVCAATEPMSKARQGGVFGSHAREFGETGRKAFRIFHSAGLSNIYLLIQKQFMNMFP